MFDYYIQGHQQGYTDALEERSKNLEHGMPLLSAIVSNDAVSTYCNGYNSGYEKGKREMLRKQESLKKVSDFTIDRPNCESEINNCNSEEALNIDPPKDKEADIDLEHNHWGL